MNLLAKLGLVLVGIASSLVLRVELVLRVDQEVKPFIMRKAAMARAFAQNDSGLLKQPAR
jgi:hypothetical protein